MEVHLQKVGAATETELAWGSLDQEGRDCARALHAMLLYCTRGRGVSVVMAGEDGNGLLAWKALTK
eukprot:1810008-Amphidinium_carterae.1